MNPVLVMVVMFLLVPLVAAAQDVCTLTMHEGSLRLIRGTFVFQGVEGMRLRPGDILETSDPGFAQLEFPGGTVVALGPSSRFYVLSHGGNTVQVVLLDGWLKGETRATAAGYRYLSPLLAAGVRDGTVVMHTAPANDELYVESGSATLSGEGGGGGPAKAGQFFSRHDGKPLTASAHLPPTFVQAMPGPFKDTLPSRLSHFAGKKVEPKREHEVSYSEVSAWLTMPSRLRRGMAARFQARLSDPAFRKSVEAHINELPDWDPILHPEKYESKPRPASANASTPPRR